MTLRQALETAAKQNPDIVLARFDEEKARQAVRIARDPFAPKIYVGSGLAYSNGFPMSIEGSAPSVFQARTVQDIFNRPQSYMVAKAKEDVRGASIATAGKRDEAVFRAASLFLDAERAARIGSLARKDTESLQKVLATAKAQVSEGRALPLLQKQAEFNLARARQTADLFEDDQTTAETSLATLLGFPAGDRVRPAEEERQPPTLPDRREDALQAALDSSPELRALASQIVSKQLEIRSQKAQRLPRVDLVAQYAMLAKFNNYDQFFRTFQRNNGQLGVSFQLPLFNGPGLAAQVRQSEIDTARLRTEMNNSRNRITLDVDRSYREAQKAETASDVARLDLELAREQLSVDLALMQEGRLGLREVEQARTLENSKWIAFYDAQYAVERARLNVLRMTGGLLALAR